MEPQLPPRPALRPGLRVVRRADGRLQIGHRQGLRVTLPDGPESRAFLDDLAAWRRPPLEHPEARRWARELLARGMVVDADQLAGVLPGPVPRAAVTAAFAETGPAAETRLAGRAAARVELLVPEPWRSRVTRLLDLAGLPTSRPGCAADVLLVVDPGGETPRSALDPCMRDGTPHLVVRNLAGRIEVGPFVAPGLTACLRCVDAHRSDRDPGHALVLEQHGPRADEPCDEVLMELALGWAARDLVSFVDGDAPRTWSASVEVEPSLRLEHQPWSRHPRCGCSWAELAVAG